MYFGRMNLKWNQEFEGTVGQMSKNGLNESVVQCTTQFTAVSPFEADSGRRLCQPAG